jgi:hypothetical protein
MATTSTSHRRFSNMTEAENGKVDLYLEEWNVAQSGRGREWSKTNRTRTKVLENLSAGDLHSLIDAATQGLLAIIDEARGEQ